MRGFNTAVLRHTVWWMLDSKLLYHQFLEVCLLLLCVFTLLVCKGWSPTFYAIQVNSQKVLSRPWQQISPLWGFGLKVIWLFPLIPSLHVWLRPPLGVQSLPGSASRPVLCLMVSSTGIFLSCQSRVAMTRNTCHAVSINLEVQWLCSVFHLILWTHFLSYIFYLFKDKYVSASHSTHILEWLTLFRRRLATHALLSLVSALPVCLLVNHNLVD